MLSQGVVPEAIPNFKTGQDEHGVFRGIAWLPITDTRAVCAELAMREQHVPIWLPEAIAEPIIHELGKALDLALDDVELAPTRDVVRKRLRAFDAVITKSGIGMYTPKAKLL